MRVGFPASTFAVALPLRETDRQRYAQLSGHQLPKLNGWAVSATCQRCQMPVRIGPALRRASLPIYCPFCFLDQLVVFGESRIRIEALTDDPERVP